MKEEEDNQPQDCRDSESMTNLRGIAINSPCMTGIFFSTPSEKACKRPARSAPPANYTRNRVIFADLADDADLFQGFPESGEKKGSVALLLRIRSGRGANRLESR